MAVGLWCFSYYCFHSPSSIKHQPSTITHSEHPCVISAMRLLSRYIIKELFMPFIFALLIIVFILFTNFLLRAIDRFLGKGIDVLTILEYLFLNLAWIVALAVPMAVLIAALMAFGRLSEDNEVTALRASGISFLTIIRPALLFGLIIGGSLVYFNNFILPQMNHRARILSGDIYRKRPGLNIEPGYFVEDLPDYSMIIRDQDGDMMQDVRIFSKNNESSQTTIYARQGHLGTIADAIIMTLYDGEIHELDRQDYGNYRRIQFAKHRIVIPADDLLLKRRDKSSRTDREMTVPMMLEKQNSYRERITTVQSRLAKAFQRTTGDSIAPSNLEFARDLINNYRSVLKQDTSLAEADFRTRDRRARSLERQAKNEYNLINSYNKSLNKYGVEIHKKFALPFSCLLFVLVGSPLGVLAKKGGFVVGMSLSFGFFLIYYLMLIGGEEVADRNILQPVVAMWLPNLILLIIALYLTLRTVRERAPVQFKLKMPNLFKRKKA